MKSNEDTDVFKQTVKLMCKINNISTRKPRFEVIDNMVVISIKNHLEDGVDLDCFNILNFIYQIISPLGVKFNQQLYLYPNSKRVARVVISFEKEDYEAIKIKVRGDTISN
ncbi:hypothetical protein [Bacillus sp. es.036]|uniref:hypothetical protein n=1 Tax=Bacillus sp. es.036 TaxID=1761764 RepID=UPI000BF46333|nr:hypothetical protein [Bacillus sp. es.036]PFG14485.1 hypothetical protein ATG70_2717 [Bacillus sp. es.036]